MNTSSDIDLIDFIHQIIPIESSMDGNRHLFRPFLHLAVAVVAVILCLYGTLGYLLYGQHVEQLIVKNVSDGGVLSDMLDVTLIISVLFTYPLQCFPVIEIIENYAFNSSKPPREFIYGSLPNIFNPFTF